MLTECKEPEMKRLMVAELWNVAVAQLPDDIGHAQREDLRRAFYFGAKAMFLLTSTPQSMRKIKMLASVEQELRAFIEELDYLQK